MPVAARAGFRPMPSSERKTSRCRSGNQVGAIQQRVAEPREQLDQRAAGIAKPRVRPLRRVRRDARDQVFDEVVEAAVVQARWKDGHARILQPSSCTVRCIVAAAPVRASR